MPHSHGIGRIAISDENSVNYRTEETLDERGGVSIGSDVVAQRADQRTFAKSIAFLE